MVSSLLLLVAILQIFDVSAMVPISVNTVEQFNDLMRSGKVFDAEKAFAAMPQSQVNTLYQDFLSTIGSVGDNGEVLHTLAKPDYDERFDSFKSSIRVILRLTEEATRDGNEVYFGITSNADWSNQRWSHRTNAHLNKGPKQSVKVPKSSTDIFSNWTHGKTEEQAATCGENKISDVRNQGSCGSCWAFSTVEQVRYDYKRLYGEDPGVLSAQFMIDCADTGILDGCNGGDTPDAISYMIQAGGIPTADAYGPYLGHKSTCKSNVAKKVIPGPSFDSSNEPDMYQYYCDLGPFTISICADHANAAVQHYAGGVMTPDRCCTKTDHRVVVVGCYNYRGTWAWVVQNSWGPSWGATETGESHRGSNGGFILMKYNANTCGLAEQATFLPRVFSVGGPYPWSHTAPLIEWDKFWGPYSGVSFTTHGGPLHSTTQATLSMCQAHAESLGDSGLIYAPASKQCVSTSGGFGVKSTGSGAAATVYTKGDKPAAHLPPVPSPSPHPPAPHPPAPHPPAPHPTPAPPAPGPAPVLHHTWNPINTLPGAHITSAHKTTTVQSAYDCAVFAETNGNSFLMFFTPSTGHCEVTTSSQARYSYGSGAQVYIYQASETKSEGRTMSTFSVMGEEVGLSRVPVMIVAFTVSALLGSAAVIFAQRFKPTPSSSTSNGYVQIEQ